MPDAVVFDVGNVLVRWEPDCLYRDVLPDPQERRHFLTEICPPDWNARFDRGEPMPDGVAEHAARHPRYAEAVRAWWSRWPEMFGPAIEESVACFRALKARGVPVFGLTNFARETFDIARSTYPFLDEFDELVVSARVGAIKPEPEIYRILEDRGGIEASRLFFIDDLEENIAGARARGWAVHHFRDPSALRPALRGAGLL